MDAVKKVCEIKPVDPKNAIKIDEELMETILFYIGSGLAGFAFIGFAGYWIQRRRGDR